MGQGRGSEATEPVFCLIEPVFCLQAKKPFHTGVRTGCHYLVRVCDIRRFYRLRELCEANFHKPGIFGSGRAWANAWNVVFRAPSRGGRGRWADVGFVVFFVGAGFFRAFHEFACSNS